MSFERAAACVCAQVATHAPAARVAQIRALPPFDGRVALLVELTNGKWVGAQFVAPDDIDMHRVEQDLIARVAATGYLLDVPISTEH